MSRETKASLVAGFVMMLLMGIIFIPLYWEKTADPWPWPGALELFGTIILTCPIFAVITRLARWLSE